MRFRLVSPRGLLAVVAAVALVPVGAVAAEALTGPAGGPLPTVSPAPRSMTAFSEGFTVPAAARLVTGAHTDPAAVAAVRSALSGAGVRSLSTGDTSAGKDALTVYVGGPAENAHTVGALSTLGVGGPAGLPSGGYTLAVGKKDGADQVVLSGVDATGTFYAAQTLRQLARHDRDGGVTLPGVQVRDWPQMAERGGEESFYGHPWSTADLTHQMDFLGQHKMNTFLYTISGDEHTGGPSWRDNYRDDEADFVTLKAGVQRAGQNHVDFRYRIDPEENTQEKKGVICHGSDADIATLAARFEQLDRIGIHNVSIGWDDTEDPSEKNGEFQCQQDKDMFNGGEHPADRAAGEAYVVDKVRAKLAQDGHGSMGMATVPVEYFGDDATEYRTEFAAKLDKDVPIFWTGPQVISPTITADDLARAEQAFGGRKLLIFDNYPVNDYVPSDGNGPLQEHLGPLVGRDPKLADHAGGLLANEMQEEEPSLIALYTVGEYTWNPGAYKADESWARALQEIGGDVAPALRAYAENSTASPLSSDAAPVLRPLIEKFEAAYRAHQDLGASAGALLSELDAIQKAPGQLRSGMANKAFVQESDGYLTSLENLAAAGKAAVHAVQAQAGGDLDGAWKARQQMNKALVKADGSGKIVAPGVYERLVSLANGPRPGTVVKTPTGGMSAFERGADGVPQTNWQTGAGSSWQGFQALGGITMQGRPCTIVTRGGAMASFVRGSDNAVWTNWQTAPGGNWHGWESLGGQVAGDPTAVLGPNGAVSVYTVGTDGIPATNWQTGEGLGWHGWQAMGGIMATGTPDAIVGPNGAVSVFVRGSDNAIWNAWQDKALGSFGGWTSLGGDVADDPTVVQGHNGAFSLFVRGSDGLVATKWQTGEGAGWQGWTALAGAGTVTGRPSATVGWNGAMSVFARGSDNAVYTTWQTGPGGNWAGWAQEYGQVSSSPFALAGDNGGDSLFAIGTDGHLATRWQDGPGTSWEAWTDLGGSLGGDPAAAAARGGHRK